MIYTLIQLLFRLLTMVIIVDIVLSFFVSPYNKVRQVLDSIVNPMLDPIRRVVPAVNNLDFSPVILLVLIQVLEYIILRFV